MHSTPSLDLVEPWEHDVEPFLHLSPLLPGDHLYTSLHIQVSSANLSTSQHQLALALAIWSTLLLFAFRTDSVLRVVVLAFRTDSVLPVFQ